MDIATTFRAYQFTEATCDEDGEVYPAGWYVLGGEESGEGAEISLLVRAVDRHGVQCDAQFAEEVAVLLTEKFAAATRRTGRDSDNKGTEAAVRQMFDADAAEAIIEADAFGALDYRVRQYCDEHAVTATEALASIEPGTRRWAAEVAENPAAFLAKKLRELDGE